VAPASAGRFSGAEFSTENKNRTMTLKAMSFPRTAARLGKGRRDGAKNPGKILGWLLAGS
jgi:hypothetical protein